MCERETWKPLSNVLVCLFLALSLLPVSSVAEGSQPVFRAGAATSNITPPLGELIVGGWKPIPAQHIHDELYARCLVLDDGKVKLGIVLCDNVGIPQEVFDLAKDQVRQATGLQKSHLLMAANPYAFSDDGTRPLEDDLGIGAYGLPEVSRTPHFRGSPTSLEPVGACSDRVGYSG